MEMGVIEMRVFVQIDAGGCQARAGIPIYARHFGEGAPYSLRQFHLFGLSFPMHVGSQDILTLRTYIARHEKGTFAMFVKESLYQ